MHRCYNLHHQFALDTLRALHTSFALHHSLLSTVTTCKATSLKVNGTRDMSFIVTLLGLSKGFEIGTFYEEALSIVH